MIGPASQVRWWRLWNFKWLGPNCIAPANWWHLVLESELVHTARLLPCVWQVIREVQGKRTQNAEPGLEKYSEIKGTKSGHLSRQEEDGVHMSQKGTHAKNSFIGPRHRNWQGVSRVPGLWFLTSSGTPQAWASTNLGETGTYSMNMWNLPVYSNFPFLKFLFFYSNFNFSHVSEQWLWDHDSEVRKRDIRRLITKRARHRLSGKKGKIKGSAWASGSVALLAELGKGDSLGVEDLILG